MCNAQLATATGQLATTAAGSYYSNRANRYTAASNRAAGEANALGIEMQGIGRQSQFEHAAMEAEFGARMAAINAELSETSAQLTLLSGQREEQKSRLATAHLKSAQRVGFAANGVDLGEGSPLNVLTTTDVMGEIDAETIRANAVRAAWGHRVQAINYKGQAAMGQVSANSIRSSAELEATNNQFAASRARAAGAYSYLPPTDYRTLINTAGAAAVEWYTYGKKQSKGSPVIEDPGSQKGWSF